MVWPRWRWRRAWVGGKSGVEHELPLSLVATVEEAVLAGSWRPAVSEPTLSLAPPSDTGWRCDTWHTCGDFIACGHYDDLPEALRVPFGESVLKALPFLRTRLGGHGQGAEVVETPRAYAELAVQLAGALIRFVVAKSLERRPKEQQPAPAAVEDDAPFWTEQERSDPRRPTAWVAITWYRLAQRAGWRPQCDPDL